MKLTASANILIVSAAVVLAFLSGFANAQVFRGHYEISVSWGSSASRITSNYEVAPGQTIQVDIGEEIVVISLQSVSDQTYDLQVSASPSTGMSLPSAAAPRVRRESFGTVIDLAEATNTKLSSSAVVSVHKIWE